MGRARESSEESLLSLVGLHGGIVPGEDEGGLGRVLGVLLVKMVETVVLLFVVVALLCHSAVGVELGGVGVRVRRGCGGRIHTAVLGAVSVVTVAGEIAAVARLADVAARNLNHDEASIRKFCPREFSFLFFFFFDILIFVYGKKTSESIVLFGIFLRSFSEGKILNTSGPEFAAGKFSENPQPQRTWK